ncbi:hypothetical protein D3C78_1464460 [compost metagenome]
MPPSAWLTRPNVLSLAPVKAPRLWPNNSLSISSAVSDGQLMVTQDFFARLLQAWIARANSPLPVPDSPRIRMLASVLATWRAVSRTTFIAGLWESRPSLGLRTSPSRASSLADSWRTSNCLAVARRS